ncbi:hypothetical protein [Bradyrhizobium stylosanthis]|uniref:hypothetical protein n=1 Tax=Bradyrhizobium stylosanthis TaxID=1803665 RepID=UPI0007C4E964|nr:hypothetical protein [Bradyrhizobium stylosanthis]
MISEILAQIRGPNFTAGIVLFDDVVVEAAPIVRYMRRWSRDRVRDYCAKQGWQITVVHQMQREEVEAPPRALLGGGGSSRPPARTPP